MFFFVPQGPFKFESSVDIDSCSTEWWKNMLYINIYFGKNGPFVSNAKTMPSIDLRFGKNGYSVSNSDRPIVIISLHIF